MKNKVCIVTYNEHSAEFYADIIRKLFGDAIIVTTKSVGEDGYFERKDADLHVVTTCAFGGSELAKEELSKHEDIVIIEKTIANKSLEKLKSIREGTKALVVNITHRMAIETIAHLTNLGINQIKFIPHDPEEKYYEPDYEIIITPGETRFIPNLNKEIIDIGDRVLSVNTIVEIALKLGLINYLEKDEFNSYFKMLPNSNYSIDHLFNKSISLESKFCMLMDTLEDGIIAVDENNIIYACNDKSKAITGIPLDYVIGKNAKNYFNEIPFEECKKSLSKINNKLIKINNCDIVVSVRPIIRMNRYIGAFAILQKFLETEVKQQKIRAQLLNKGHCAKYTFNDILGKSLALEKSKKLAKKMANSNAPIMITGESGTGKELFANAIHNESMRSQYPFVAVNCGALPDNLLESELFGYEDGAFTGAKKGGKLGLFEFAHKGTLFLDEVEAMTPMLQVKLLRVLQEKEVRRLGGDSVINIDVRIIAATNEKITELVSKGDFRKDLYYRLCTLPIDIPPLRDRGEDVFLLIDDAMRKLGGDFKLSDDVVSLFKNHRWDGNIRELKNYVEYFCYIGDEVIEKDDLPSSFTELLKLQGHKEEENDYVVEKFKRTAGNRIDSYLFVLNIINVYQENNSTIGRKLISEKSQGEGYNLSEQEVRTILTNLESINLISISKGRGGTKILKQGREVLKNL